jgi:hypothetical protein
MKWHLSNVGSGKAFQSIKELNTMDMIKGIIYKAASRKLAVTAAVVAAYINGQALVDAFGA